MLIGLAFGKQYLYQRFGTYCPSSTDKKLRTSTSRRVNRSQVPQLTVSVFDNDAYFGVIDNLDYIEENFEYEGDPYFMGEAILMVQKLRIDTADA